MREYIFSIAAMAILSAVCDILLPKGWRAYVRTVTGLLLIMTIIRPIADIGGITFPESFAIPEEITAYGDTAARDLVKAEAESRISQDIKERLAEELSVGTEVSVRLDTDFEGKITGVRSVIISGKGLTEEVRKRINEIYAPGEVILNER